MKMIYGGTPVNSLKVRHYETNTNDATIQPSDVQAGVTYYARGEKGVGTGKSFEFASYGKITTGTRKLIPTLINVVEITSIDYPIKSLIGFAEMINVDFATEQTIGIAVVDGVEFPITLKIEGNILTFGCEETITLEFFYGRDNYT